MRNPLFSSVFSRVVVSSLLVAGAAAGCSSSGSSRSGNGDDDAPPQDDGETPFTNGVSTLAGMADAGYVDGARKVAQFSNPVNVLYKDGILYVADFDNGRLRAIDTDSHVTTTIINQPGFQRPFGMAFAADGSLYVSTDNDSVGNHTPMSGSIWRVDIGAKTATIVANAIGRPRGLAVLPDGRIAAADYLHHIVEVIDPSTGQATTLAGSWDGAGMVDGAGTTARFSAPYNIAVKSDGTLLVTDFDNNRIRSVKMDGTTSTVAGGGTAGFADGTMTSAQFSHPQAMAQADNGDIYVSDLGNFRVRRFRGTDVETIAGDGQMGYLDNDNPLASEIYGLEGLSVVPDGSMVYVADGNRGDPLPYNRVRQIKLQ